jgi:hypothetical protein
MPLHTLGNLLVATDELKALTAGVRRMQKLQSLYARTAPRDLAKSSRVKSCEAGTLLVSADNAAVASKLKQLAPRLLVSIRENEAEITKIRIEVQVGGRAPGRVYQPQKKALTPGTLSKLDGLAAGMPEGSLKSALARLVRRQRDATAGSDQNQALDHEQNHRDDHHDERELQRAPGPGEVAPVAGKQKKPERDRHRK